MSKISKTKITEQDGVFRYDYPEDVSLVVVCGDIHGSFTQIAYKVAMQMDIHNALIIIAGDCGFGFNRIGFYDALYQRKVAKLLKKNNIRFAFVRGNHDNPEYFSRQLINHERWRTIPDYSVINSAGHDILCVGGATSIDRSYRTSMRNNAADRYDGDLSIRPAYYWSNEAPVFDSNKLDTALELSHHLIDTVITHTAPSFCEFCDKGPIVLEYAENDKTLLEDCDNEREEMDKLFEALISREEHLPLQNWIYGHFHASRRMTFHDISFTMLDCEELKQLY